MISDQFESTEGFMKLCILSPGIYHQSKPGWYRIGGLHLRFTDDSALCTRWKAETKELLEWVAREMINVVQWSTGKAKIMIILVHMPLANSPILKT